MSAFSFNFDEMEKRIFSPSLFMQSQKVTRDKNPNASNKKNSRSSSGSSSAVELGNPVLARYWMQFCTVAWLLFIIFELAVGFDRLSSEKPLCPASDIDYPEWYWRTNFGCLGAFIFILCVLLTRLLQQKTGTKRIPLLVAFNIVTMATVATILSLCFEWGGVCVDSLGVASPAAIWGEWIACGPLLIFITVTIVDKPYLTRTDWLVMITFFLCLLSGFLIIIPQSYSVGLFWLSMSCLTYLPVLGLPWYDIDIRPVVALEGRELNLFAEGYAIRYNLVMWLTIVLPLYTVNYLFALFGTINAAQTIVIYQILSVFTKGLFAAATMDIHLDLLCNAEKLLVEEQRANDARRAFMKYIFHEVRTPLNSITMGIDLLEMSSNINPSERDSLLMMKSASEFMSDTLDNVLSLQKIEEGKFELELVPFSFEQMILRVFAAFRGAATKKNMFLCHSILPLVPLKLIGDVHRIEHIVSNLLSNAIKFSPEGKRVKVEIFCDAITRSNDGRGIANVTVSVEDEGPGISMLDQAKLFDSFVQIRPGTLQKGQGSGLGLSFCKQIVEFHGGYIRVVSNKGHGSKFLFTIPFPIALSSDLTFDNPNSVLPSPKVGYTRLPETVECTVRPYTVESSVQNSVQIRPMNFPLKPMASRDTVASNDRTGSNDVMVSSTIMVTSSNIRVPNPALSTLPAIFLTFKVLVVDDADSNRKMLEMILKKKGLLTNAKENGQEAVDIILEDLDAYKLIFMDNLMPVMNGSDAARALRVAGYTHMIVGVTGNSLEDDLNDFLASGADMAVAKPFKKLTLDLIIDHIDKFGTLSRPDMKLIQKNNALEWVPRINADGV